MMVVCHMGFWPIETAWGHPDMTDMRTASFESDIIGPAQLAEARARLARIRKLAWWLNGAFRIPGVRMRFGLDTLIGLVPGGGDAVTALFSLYIVYEGYRLGVRGPVVMRMLGNVAIEAAVGMIPVLGDLFDTAFKADFRNIELIERALGPL